MYILCYIISYFLQDRINRLESQLRSAEGESSRRRQQLEQLLERLEKEKEDARKAIDKNKWELEKVKS